MGRIRKTDKVSKNAANLAFVGGKKITPADVDVTPVVGGHQLLDRRIMYADIAGRLIDGATGKSTVHDAFPVVTDMFYDKDLDRLLDANEVVAHAALPFVHTSTRPYLGPAAAPTADTMSYDSVNDLFIDAKPGRYSVNTENILLTYEDGTPYDGSYHIVVQRYASTGIIGEVVDKTVMPTDLLDLDESEHDGMAAHRVWVHLDRDDVTLYLKFVAAEVADVDGIWRPSNIDAHHVEKISQRPLYTYDHIAEVVNPTNVHKRIVASQKTDKGYDLYVPGAAIVDDRQPDFFFWRLRANFTRSTPTYAVEKDTVRVGVIGNVPQRLNDFLSGSTQDMMTKRKVTFVNPLVASHESVWQAGINWALRYDSVIARMLNYDVLVWVTDKINWLHYGKYFNTFIARGGTLIIDVTGAKAPVVLDAVGHERLGLKFSSLPQSGNLLFDENQTIAQELKSAAIGYDISDSEVDYMTFQLKNSLASYYKIYPLPAEGRVIYDTVSSDNCSLYAKNCTRGGRLFVSGMGFTQLNDSKAQQLLVNMLLSAGRRDAGTVSGSVATKFSVTTPWRRDWVLGVDEHGRPVLDATELKKYGFFMSYNATTGTSTPKRALGGKTAKELVSSYVMSDAHARGIVLPSDGIDYVLEIKADSGHVKGAGAVNGSDMPVVWTDRVTNRLVVPDGWRLGRFTKDNIKDTPVVVDAHRPFSGAIMARYEGPTSLDISFNVKTKFSYREIVQKTVEKTVDNKSGLLAGISTWSDIAWHAVHGGDPAGDRNLWSWGGVTKYRWYPWDGQSMLLSTARGSTGSDVAYIQDTLNMLHYAKRDSAHQANGDDPNEINPYLPLKVDGVYGRTTEKAVTWYQAHWYFTADGDVDAGTCGHILRNIGHLVNEGYGGVWTAQKDRWRKFGPLENMLDGDSKTHHGRRSWINMSRDTAMSDAIYISLKQKMKVTDVLMRPTLSGTAADCLTITKVGGSLGSVESWDINGALYVSDEEQRTIDMRDRDVDHLYVHFRQDHPFLKNSKMWAFTHLLFHGTVMTSTTVIKEREVSFPINDKIFTIAGDTPFIYEWTPDEAKVVGSNFVRYNETEEQLAQKILDSIEALHPGYSQHFSVTVTFSGAKIRIQIAHKEAHLPVSYASKIAINNGVCTLTVTDALGFADVGEQVSGVGIFDLGAGAAQDVQGFNKTVTIASATTLTFAVPGHANVAQYDTTGQVGLIVVSDPWSDYLSESETIKVNDYSDEIDALIATINSLGENWRVMLAPMTLSGSNDVNVLFYDESGQKMFTSMTLSEFRERRGTIKLAAVARSVETEDPDGIRATVYPKLYAMRPYGVILRGGYGTFGVTGISGDQLDEAWGLEVAIGEITKTIYVPDTIKPTVSPLKTFLRTFRRKQVQAFYDITGGPYEATLGQPYVKISLETPLIIDDSTIKLNRAPIAYGEDGLPYLAIYVNGELKKDYAYIDADDGLIGFVTPMPEDPIVQVTYNIVERSVVYLGAKDAFGTSFFDVCPVRGHKTTINGVDKDATDLLGRPIYVYAYPRYFEYKNAIVKPNIRTGLQHTTDRRIFDKKSSEYDPFALLIATVTMKRIDGDTSIVIDARRGGGGVDDNSVLEAKKRTTEVEGFFDLGYMDGDAYLPGGTVVVKLPSAWKTAWGSQFMSMAEKTFSKVVPAGKTVVILWSDGAATSVSFDSDDFDLSDFE